MPHNITTYRALYQHNSFNDGIVKSVDNLRMSFGKQLAQARKRLKLTQPQLARLCGWESQSRISMYERGEREPSIQEIVKLSDILKAPLDNLLRDRPLNESTPTLTPQQRTLLALFGRLTTGQQNQFLEEMRKAKQHNDDLYHELKSKYEDDKISSEEEGEAQRIAHPSHDEETDRSPYVVIESAGNTSKKHSKSGKRAEGRKPW